MKEEFLKTVFKKHQLAEPIPSMGAVCKFADRLLQTLFPPLSEMKFSSVKDLEIHLLTLERELYTVLDGLKKQLNDSPENLAGRYMKQLPLIYDHLEKDVQAIVLGDPAAKTELEVILTYPGFYAIAMYRIAHALHLLEIPYLPRVITEYAHSKTGIDIHPGANIEPYFCIDHGTGVVIGETTIIGKYVKIYQGVTLGALSVAKEMASVKRHPTIEDNVVIYSGATILGGDTVIGENSIIGGNVWITKSIPPHSTVYH
ncbi:MAG TPA: serine O-acetyltransferase EpsC, partial [Cytophagaceae bacterium]